MQDHLLSVGHVEGHIACVEEVVVEPLLEHVLLIACADDEIVNTVRRIALHDMPYDGHTADLHHRLRAVL